MHHGRFAPEAPNEGTIGFYRTLDGMAGRRRSQRTALALLARMALNPQLDDQLPFVNLAETLEGQAISRSAKYNL